MDQTSFDSMGSRMGFRVLGLGHLNALYVSNNACRISTVINCISRYEVERYGVLNPKLLRGHWGNSHFHDGRLHLLLLVTGNLDWALQSAAHAQPRGLDRDSYTVCNDITRLQKPKLKMHFKCGMHLVRDPAVEMMPDWILQFEKKWVKSLTKTT